MIFLPHVQNSRMKFTVATDLTAVQKTQPLVVGGLAPNRYTGALVLDCALQQIIIESI